MSKAQPSISRLFLPYLLVVLAIVVAGAIWLGMNFNRASQGERDLRTPAQRLIGHWLLYSQSEVPFSHMFFGPSLTDDNNRGTVSMIDVDGMVFRGHYRMVRQFPHGLDMDMVQDLGPNLSRKVTLTIDREGLSGRYRYVQFDAEIDLRMTYVDDAATPPDGFVESLKASKN